MQQTKAPSVQIFGNSATHVRYEAMLRVLEAAIIQHKTTGVNIGFNVLGTTNPKALSNRLPASQGKLAESDNRNLIEQMRVVLADNRIINVHGVYDVIYNADEEIQPRFDFYIVPVPVGKPILDLLDLL